MLNVNTDMKIYQEEYLLNLGDTLSTVALKWSHLHCVVKEVQ